MTFPSSNNILKEISLRYSCEADTYLLKRPFLKTYVGRRIVKIFTLVLMLYARNRDSIKIINVACGPATHEQIVFPLLEKLRKMNYYWISLDISLEMVKKVKNLASPRTDCIVADAQHLPFRENAFDLIIVSRAIKFIHPMKCFLGLHKLMKKLALLILVVDVADALWCRLLEKIGLPVDPAIYNNMRTFHNSQILKKLESAGLKVLMSVPITSLPLSLFKYKLFRNVMEYSSFFRRFDSNRIIGSRITLYICRKS